MLSLVLRMEGETPENFPLASTHALQLNKCNKNIGRKKKTGEVLSRYVKVRALFVSPTEVAKAWKFFVPRRRPTGWGTRKWVSSAPETRCPGPLAASGRENAAWARCSQSERSAPPRGQERSRDSLAPPLERSCRVWRVGLVSVGLVGGAGAGPQGRGISGGTRARPLALAR